MLYPLGSVRSLLLLIGAIAPSYLLGHLLADDQPQPKKSAWQQLFRKQAAEYKIVVAETKDAEASLVPDPILNWSQPVRGGADGAVFVWKFKGRPVAIGTLFIWPMDDGRQGIAHEMQSLSKAPLIATWRDHRWTPPANSIVWTRFSDAPVPDKSPERRLRQMRDLVRQFSAESYDKKDRRWELRSLTSPIYRYELDLKKDEPVPASDDLLDGALFGFVEGTDLEIVVSIQAVQSTEGDYWEYAFSRMSDFRLISKLGEKTVWEVKAFDYGNSNPRLAYYNSTVESRRSAEDE